MNDIQITEKILTRKPVFDGIIIHVEHWQAELPNGQVKPREVAVNVGASSVVTVAASGNVYRVLQ